MANTGGTRLSRREWRGRQKGRNGLRRRRGAASLSLSPSWPAFRLTANSPGRKVEAGERCASGRTDDKKRSSVPLAPIARGCSRISSARRLPELPDWTPDASADGEVKWRLYEKVVADTQEKYPDCTVVRDHRITGVRSGVIRQIDVWVTGEVAGHEIKLAIRVQALQGQGRYQNRRRVHRFSGGRRRGQRRSHNDNRIHFRRGEEGESRRHRPERDDARVGDGDRLGRVPWG